MANKSFNYKANYTDALNALKTLNAALKKQGIVAKDVSTQIHYLADGTKSVVGSFKSLETGSKQLSVQLQSTSEGYKVSALNIKDLTNGMRLLQDRSKKAISRKITNELTQLDEAVKGTSGEWSRYQSALLKVNEYHDQTTMKSKELQSIVEAVGKGEPLKNLTKEAQEYYNLLVRLAEAAKKVGAEHAKIESAGAVDTASLTAARQREEEVKKLISQAFDPTEKTKWGDKEFFGDAPIENIRKMVEEGNRLIAMAGRANVSMETLADSIKKGFNREIKEGGVETGKLNAKAMRLAETFARLAASGQMTKERFNALDPAMRKSIKNFVTADKEAAQFHKTIDNFKRLVLARVVTTVFYRIVESARSALIITSELMIKMAEVQTILPHIEQTSSAFEQLSYSIRKVSEAYNIQQVDTASAYYQSLSNQITNTISETEHFVGVAAKLSKAAIATLPESIDALSSALNSYNYTVSESTKLSEDMFNMVEMGRIKLGDVANQIGNVTSVAADLGVSFDDITSSLAQITIKGIQPRVAMTLLRNVLYKLQDPTDSMTDALHQMGVETGTQAIATFGLTGVLDNLVGMLGKGSKAFSDVFGTSRALRGAIALLKDEHESLNEALEEGEDKVEKYANAYEVRMANAAENVNKQLTIFKNFFISDLGQTVINFADTFNTHFNEMLGTTDSLSTTLRGVSKILISLVAGVATFTSLNFTLSLLGQIAGKISSIIKLMKTQEQLTFSFYSTTGLLNMSFKSLSASLGILAGVITSVIILFNLFHKDAKEQLKETVEAYNKGLNIKLSDTLKKFGKNITEQRVQVKEQIQKMMKDVIEPFKEVSDQIALLEFEQKVEGTLLENLKEQLNIEKDILSVYEDRTRELEKHLDHLESAIESTWDLQRASQFEQEDFWFDRATRGLNDIDKAFAKLDRSDYFLDEYLGAFEELSKDPQKFLANFDILQEYFDRYKRSLIEGDQELYQAYNQLAQDENRMLTEQFGPGNFQPVIPEDFYNFDMIGGELDKMFGLQDKMIDQKLQFEQEDYRNTLQQYENEIALLEEQRIIVQNLEEDIEKIIEAQEYIEALQQLQLSNEYSKSKQYEEQLGIINDIAGKYENISESVGRALEREKLLTLEKEKQQKLKDVTEKAEDVSIKMSSAQTAEGQASESVIRNINNIDSAFNEFVSSLDYLVKKLESKKQDVESGAAYDSYGIAGEQREIKIQDIESDLREATDILVFSAAEHQKLSEIYNKIEEGGTITPEDIENIKSITESIERFKIEFDNLISNLSIDDDTSEILTTARDSLASSVVGVDQNMQSFLNATETLKDTHKELNTVQSETSRIVNQLNPDIYRLDTATNALRGSFDDFIRYIYRVSSLSVNPQQRATGGFINWKSSGTDTVPAMLTPGEFVVKASVAKSSRKFLEMLNAGHFNLNDFQREAVYSRPRPVYMSEGGSVSINNNNNITLQSTGYNDFDAVVIGKALNREQRKGTLSLSGKRRLY